MKRTPSIILTVVLLAFTAVAFAGLEQAQKIGEIKAGSEDLWTFLRRLPASFQAQIFYAAALFGALGMLANYAVKWMRKDIAGSLITYLFFQNLRGTLLSFSTTLGIGIAAITGGVFETGSGEFVGWFNVMWVSLTNGFMWDAALNRGGQEVEQGDGNGGRT